MKIGNLETVKRMSAKKNSSAESDENFYRRKLFADKVFTDKQGIYMVYTLNTDIKENV